MGVLLCVCVFVFVKSKMHRPVVEFDGALCVIAFGTCPKHLLSTSAEIIGNLGEGGEVWEAVRLYCIT